MKITVLGCGHAFSKLNYNQSFMLTETTDSGKTRNMVIDFGAKIPIALDKLNISIHDIDDVYISHAHGDHTGGLEELLLSRYDWKTYPRPRNWREYKSCVPICLIAEQGFMEELWDHTLSGGLKTMEGFIASLDTFAKPLPIDIEKSFKWQGWTCQIVQQIHIMSGAKIQSSYGMNISRKGYPSIYFTTDSQHCSPRQIEIFYRNADIIFQDCELIGVDMVKRHSDFYSGVHANYAQLAGFPSANSVVLSDDIKAKMYLSHYQDILNEKKDYKGQFCDWELEAKKDGFAGFVHVGDVFEIRKGQKKPIITNIFNSV